MGATPRFADVDERTQLLTAGTLEPALTRATRCVIPVHLYGRTVELDPIVRLAREHGLHVLEDAAQAHGARYRGRRVGTIGTATVACGRTRNAGMSVTGASRIPTANM